LHWGEEQHGMERRSEHWNSVYEQRAPDQVSWFQDEARISLELIEACAIPASSAVVDVGAGASRLVDGLLARGYQDVTLVDVAENAFVPTRERLPEADVTYLVSDITRWRPSRSFHLWHDRAVFHFLAEASDRAAYRSVLAEALMPDGHVIIGTFALDGPERCSGLPVQRYSAETLAQEFADLLRPVESRSEMHTTPAGSTQSFTFVRFARIVGR
jgi:trans-aconitate methyltransferase